MYNKDIRILMRKHVQILATAFLSLSFITNYASAPAVAPAAKGPMNADWFYDQQNPYKNANELYQQRNWQGAQAEYEALLGKQVGTDYDRNMARLNLAQCNMAQGKTSSDWAAFDDLIGIPKNRQIPGSGGSEDYCGQDSVLIRTDQVGIGDIAHLWEAVPAVQNKNGLKATISIRGFLKGTFADTAKNSSVDLVGEKDAQPVTTYETHIVSLLGHLNMAPKLLQPSKPLLTAPQAAHDDVKALVDPILAKGGKIAAVFLGENRPATLMGGKQLPRDPKEHGRQLTSAPFEALLRNHDELTLIDCGTKDSRIVVGADLQDRCKQLPAEKQAFDTIAALALLQNKHKNIVAFGADNGPTNVYARTLDSAAQDRMALIIPNDKEYDMRMEGEGAKYKQRISDCWVYKCAGPDEQTQAIETAYNDMTK